ncbi:hypothetical protein [Niabella aquatica]
MLSNATLGIITGNRDFFPDNKEVPKSSMPDVSALGAGIFKNIDALPNLKSDKVVIVPSVQAEKAERWCQQWLNVIQNKN